MFVYTFFPSAAKNRHYDDLYIHFFPFSLQPNTSDLKCKMFWTYFCTFFHENKLVSLLTIWLIKWTVVSKVKAVMVHCDPVNISAALICNGRHFGWLIVRWGVVDRVLRSRMCMYLSSYVGVGDCAQMTEAWYARIIARTVPLKWSSVKGVSANCVLVWAWVHSEGLSNCDTYHWELLHPESLTHWLSNTMYAAVVEPIISCVERKVGLSSL